MATMRSQDAIRNTVVSLGLPEHPYFMRRTARALDLLDTGKINFVSDDIYRVHSQFDDTVYHVELNHGTPGCTCVDHQKNPGVLCKHMIAATIYQKQAPAVQNEAITIIKTTEGNEGDYWKRCWTVKQGNRRVMVYDEQDRRLFCNCGAFYRDCDHKQLVIKMVTNQLKQKPIVNECGSNEAQALQDKLNGQHSDSRNDNDNGNGAHKAPSLTGGLSTQITTDNIDPLSRPFVDSERLDEQQILSGEGGNAHYLGCVTKLKANLEKYTEKEQEQIDKLNEYVISYKGIMELANKHHITFETAIHDDTHTVIAKGRCGTSERVSGKPINGNEVTAMELAKRNAARQLLPLEKIKAVEQKAKLNAEFDWNIAYQKAVEIVGGKAQVDCVINDLVKSGKLRADNPSGYDRTEYLLIYQACKDDPSNDSNDGGDNAPSSNDDEVNQYKVLADAPVNDNWWNRYQECVGLVGMNETDLIIWQRLNFRYSYYKNKITDDQWDEVLQECRFRWNARQAKAEFASSQREYKLNHIRWKTGYDVQSKKYVGRPPANSTEFLAKCQEEIEKVRDEKKSIEANEQPLESSNGKRKLKMDRKLKTWLMEADGTRKPISCKEICEQFEDSSLVTRLRQGIDSGADISTVELDN